MQFKNIKILIKTYALAISIFFVFRFILFINQLDRIDFSEEKVSTILQAFIMGIRFDVVVSGYILLLPAVILLVIENLGRNSLLVYRFAFYWIFSFFSIAFFICAGDIPYFNQFFSRISISVFEWADNLPFVFNMIIEEPKYIVYLIPLTILVTVFYKRLKPIILDDSEPIKAKPVIGIVVSLLFLGIMFIGIRGRIEKKSPIRIGTAYFTNHAFLNQLGLNPVFTLLRTYLDSKKEENKTVHFMDAQLAINTVQESLHIQPSNNASPIQRNIIPDSISSNTPNVIFIIMESMSAAKMTRHGNPNKLTPFLDSISHQSIYFDNVYTAGIHTFNGIFSTLFSFPALYRQHTMKKISQYNGINSALAEHGYTSIFFTTHDGQFDNVEGFLNSNGFDKIISQADYPSEEIKTTLGVPDDYMFEFSMPIIEEQYKKGQPFFVSYMTASDHGPFYIPDYFTPSSENIKEQIVEYADWSLRKFITMCSTKEWFDNTFFVFVADHGAALDAMYDIPLNYHHSPLIFYAPKLIDSSKTYSCMGGQIDIFPTTLGMLNLPYMNNTLGIDLLKEERPAIYINGDDKIGVLDQEFLLIFKEKEEAKLYKYRSLDKTDYAQEYPEKAKAMEVYAKSNMQVYQNMLLNNTLKVEKVVQ